MLEEAVFAGRVLACMGAAVLAAVLGTMESTLATLRPSAVRDRSR